MWKRLFLAVFVFLAFEVGAFLILFPWSELWEKNVLLHWAPSLRPVFGSAYCRGAVSGLGLWNVLLGAHEAIRFKRTIREMEEREAAEAVRLTETHS
jgi:hypothetical protein